MRFQRRIAAARKRGELVVQPRMGYGQPHQMRNGLRAVRDARATTVGTATLDSFTRVADYQSVARAIAEGELLNGYPIVNHGPLCTKAVLEGIQSEDFPIQVRHGSAKPEAIFTAIAESGIDATEGGPVSYCLPYGRVPLDDAIDSWRRCADIAASAALHLETFGGCLLGQMCPPSMLTTISVLEAMFFAQRGVGSVSLSYAQQTSFAQDVAAIRALRRLASRFLPSGDHHLVLYTFMGVFPRTPDGARDLLRESVRIARVGRAERLIVKTVAEAHRIPTIDENVEALELAAETWRALSQVTDLSAPVEATDHEIAILSESLDLIESVLELHPDIGEALRLAFEKGYLDVPFCLHKNNLGLTRAVVDEADGTLQWNRIGRLPIKPSRLVRNDAMLDPYGFLKMLSTNERRFDAPYLQGTADAAAPITRSDPGRSLAHLKQN
jgi:methylaspartate mutase epsilon subunit